MNSSPIVITGAGAVCGAGLTTDAIWNAVKSGKSAVAPIRQWDASRWPIGIAAELAGVDNRTLVQDRKLHKILSRTDMFGLYAAGAAIDQSGIVPYRQNFDPDTAARYNDRSGVFAGSGGGVYRSNYDFFPLLNASNGNLQKFGSELGATVNPMWLLKNLPNNVLCHVGIQHGFKGTNGCITNQCVGGALAVGEAAGALRGGEADRMVAVGHDAPIEPETVFHYHRLGLLADEILQPFDEQRRGTVFGEGAAALVLETKSSASERKAAILGEFLGSGCTTEATGIVDVRPDGDGLSRAIRIALEEAQLSPERIGMIVAHANGTRASDASEAAALRAAFGQSLPPVTGFKWAYGHCIAASAVLDIVIALKALQENIVPGIATLQSKDPDLGALPVSAQPQKPRSKTALVLCRGFGGMNVALIIQASNGEAV